MWNCSGHQGYVFLRSHQVSEKKAATIIKHGCEFSGKIVESGGWSRQYASAEKRTVVQIELSVFARDAQNVESNADLKNFDVGSAVTEDT